MPQFALLQEVYAPFDVDLVWASWETPVAKWFTNHRWADGDDFNQAFQETKDNAAYMEGSRRGLREDLTVWIVNDITTINSDFKPSGVSYKYIHIFESNLLNAMLIVLVLPQLDDEARWHRHQAVCSDPC